MEMKIKAIIAIILSVLVNITWILGLIFGDISFFGLSMIILIVAGVFAIKNFKDIGEFFKTFKEKDGNIVDDERTEYIEERASMPAWAAVMVTNIYAGIAILTLRNIYPEYIPMAYAFIFTAIFGFITFTISRTYYKRRYSD